jgi:hypothetical protein
MQTPAKQALACWAVAALGLGLLLRIALGPAGSAEGAGEALGRLFALTGAAALATWWLARRRTPAWGWTRFAGAYVLAVLLLAAVSAFGRARAAPLDEAWPLQLELPAPWTGERLEGLSSAPQDQALGRRLRLRHDDANGTALIELSCGWRERLDESTPAQDVLKLQRSLADALSGQGLEAALSPPRVERRGARQWHVADVTAQNDEGVVLRQRFALSQSERCALTAVLAGQPAAFEAQQDTFDRALATLRSD